MNLKCQSDMSRRECIIDINDRSVAVVLIKATGLRCVGSRDRDVF